MHVTTHKSTRNNEEDASKITKLHRNLNKDNAIAEEVNKHKASKVKSEPHQGSFWMLRILIMFFKFLGLAAFAHHIITRKKRLTNTFQYSQLGIVYNVVLCSLLIASTYLSIPYILHLDYENKSNLTTGIEILQGILGTIVMCAILLSFCIDQKSLVRIANRLVDIEHEMDRLYHLYRPLRRQRIFHALIIVCVLKIFLLISLVSTEHLAFDTGPVSWMSDIMPTFHVGWLLMQYYLLVSIIQADFVDVNQAIESLTSASTPDHQPQSLNQTRRVVVGNSTVHQLLQLQNVHCHLCEISEDVSEFYSLPVLFGFAFLFLTLIYNGYYLLSPLLMTDEILEYVVLSNTIIWLIFLIYPISLLTNRITRFLNEVSKTGSVVHSLLSCTIGKETKSELKQFSLQLLHRKLEFTANGYFALDNSFFHSLIGTVATYLVILVQFQMGSSCSSNPECNCTKEDLSKVE
ncbi:PREDICTED: putative gustatory receptor 28a [Vollenhovia emeryi]|uniref:putative gustatory receptor 28a n=1 Tax=Vollenhovia emeryi TaxID=411798 RepID=UPI0005F587D1|nr:PREDICTED: putative gustatory receptor 28a [Vollenhovia emeryi]